jgi:hypothetical protein
MLSIGWYGRFNIWTGLSVISQIKSVVVVLRA